MRVKESFESKDWRKKAYGLLFFLLKKATKQTDLLVTLDDFYGKNAKFSR